MIDAVYRSPDDLDLREVVGDSLLEAGDLRGRFIQLQCLQAPTSQQRLLAARLLYTHRRQWLGPLKQVVRLSARFERGFVHEVTFRSEAMWKWEQVAEAPQWSTVRRVRMSQVRDAILRRLPRLEAVFGDYGRDGLVELLDGPVRPWKVFGFDARLADPFADPRVHHDSQIQEMVEALPSVLPHCGAYWTRSQHLRWLRLPAHVHTLVLRDPWLPREFSESVAQVGRLGFCWNGWLGEPTWLLLRSGEELRVVRKGAIPDPPRQLLRLMRDLKERFVIRRVRVEDHWLHAAPPGDVAILRLQHDALEKKPRHRAVVEEVVMPEHWPVPQATGGRTQRRRPWTV